MKAVFLTIFFGIIFQLSPSFASEGHHHVGSDNHKITTSKSYHMGAGIINNISRMNRSINITHDPIKSLNWPKMTMDLPVSDDVNLKSIPMGEEVKFKIELGKDKVYRVVEVKAHGKIDRHNHKDNHHHD